MDEQTFLNMHPIQLTITSYRIHPAPLDNHFRRELNCSKERFNELMKEHTRKWMDVIKYTKQGRKVIKRFLGIKIKKRDVK